MTRIALNWRKIPQRYNLIGTKCTTCETYYFPPRIICPKCRRKSKMDEHKFCGEGEVLTYTLIYSPPQGFENIKPYILAIIKLNEGPSLTAQIIDCKIDDVKIGSKVKSVFRKIVEEGDEGVILYGYKFKLVK
ncbi:MAG: transcriptional regulator [Candidatus Altiarchaeales archaeon HGW-Altiarchaeales-1]|nr:MAG: transcriptional regulator [Candidatus Altiarchaeales archaeon HGW-Altiarchaeales-2]PKP61428.1 MAG: transcriptional regulator [Candidatus Altiarchaeales archaeon HGW-Altiarchaeales-1]